MTSWNWLYLTDYSSTFKKTYLPEDNPADFSYYFDTSGRRTCYLAPERFLAHGDEDDGRGVTWAMDIFSTGCVIAELFVESPIFSLSQLYKYRKGEYHPEFGYLSKIRDDDVRDLVAHMIHLEPESRYSAEEYLNFWRRKAFPEYFYSFLHHYLGMITDPSSGRSPVVPDDNFGESDERIDRVYHDFDKISYFLGYEGGINTSRASLGLNSHIGNLLPLEIDIPNDRHKATPRDKCPRDYGSLIFLTLVVSSLRNTARSTAKLRSLDLMLAFAERTTDEAKLDRILPYMIGLLGDRSDLVKIAALRSVAQLLALVRVISPVNVHIFSEYVRPRLVNFAGGFNAKTASPVRAMYAFCLASLAQTSARLLDTAYALKAEGTIPTVDPEAENGATLDLAYQHSFDVAKLDLIDHFESQTKALLTDTDAAVRRAFLSSVSSLCVFFGETKANDVILSHLNTYLNDRNWMLKCAFFRTVVGVAAFVGGTNFEEFILPLMIQTLTDPEEFVVQQVVTSLASIAELGLLQRSKTWEILDIVARFLIHPNLWIKEAAAHFIAASTTYLSVADLHCIIAPLLLPYFKCASADFIELGVLEAVCRPLPRPALEMALVWATKAQSTVFWKPAQKLKTFSFGSADQTLSTISSKDLHFESLDKMNKSEEDEQWINRLQNIGMMAGDGYKLVALREYLWRVASKRGTTDIDLLPSKLNNILPLRDVNNTPRTIFFDSIKKRRPLRRSAGADQQRSSSKNKRRNVSHTIADALLEASSATNDPSAYRKISHANSAKTRSINNDRRIVREDVLSNPVSPVSTSSRGRFHSKERSNTSDSNEMVTPTGSFRTGYDQGLASGIRHKSSAINLLNRKDNGKTSAETSTSPANAVGKMDGLVRQNSSDAVQKTQSKQTKQRQTSSSPAPPTHTYNGNDPNVLRLLDSMMADNFPADVVDFGPMVTPIRSCRSTDEKQDTQSLGKSWRPDGSLLATFTEHKGSVCRVLPAPDHAFFITGSTDGTVKVWDTTRLERNLAYRSRQTYILDGSPMVTGLCFVENTHTFVCAANDGSIRVVKVDYSFANENPKYASKPREMRQCNLKNGEHAVWLEHYKADSHSILIMATNFSRIVALDLRNMSELYSLQNPVHHGIPTCFCVDKLHGWLLLGTTRGILSLWDLRFRLRLRAFGLTGGSPIHRLLIHPFRSRYRKVVVAGGTGRTEFTIWDIEKSECREVFRAGVIKGGSGGVSREFLKSYEPWKFDDSKSNGVLGRFATAINGTASFSTESDRGVRALAVRLDEPDEKGESKTGFYLTGGVDRKLRLWDTSKPEGSTVLSGLDVEEDPPKFQVTQPTTSLIVHSEKTGTPPGTSSNTQTTSNKSSPTGGPNGKSSSSTRQSRSAVISARQRALLKNHLDVITDVCILERPVRMVISVDRMGCIYVFQ